MIEWSEFSPKALDFIANSDARLNILHGAVRSSKTINCTVRWLQYLVEGPAGDLVMLGKTMATLQRNVLNDMFDIVGPKNYHWESKQQGVLIILNRRVYCYGASNEEAESKIRGATFAGALCDEVSLYPQSVFNQLMARLSVKGAQCFCNTNPDSPFHWFYTDYIINEEIVNKKIWHFTMEDNLSLDKEFIKSLKQIYVGVWFQRMILGLWVAAEGLIYDMYKPEIHMIDTKAYLLEHYKPNTIRWLVACDYGTSTVMSWGLYALTPDRKYFKVKQYYYNAEKEKKQHTDSEFAREFAIWLGKVTPYTVIVDPSAASWKEELRQRGYKIQNANNDVVNGIRFVGSLLATGRYFIDKSCTDTNQEYGSYVWDKKAQLKGEDKPLKEHDHACDTDRYALYTTGKNGLSGVY